MIYEETFLRLEIVLSVDIPQKKQHKWTSNLVCPFIKWELFLAFKCFELTVFLSLRNVTTCYSVSHVKGYLWVFVSN